MPYVWSASGTSEKEASDKSLVTGTARTGEEAPLLGRRPVTTGTLVICSFYLGARFYEQMIGWDAGLDSLAPELFHEPWCL